MEKSISPIMPVGKYAGSPIDTLPNSYLRWIVTQKFPVNILAAAKSKLEASDYNDLFLSVSRHAIDMYSKRFLPRWIHSEANKEKGKGLATFIAESAQEAWDKGRDVSKHRHQDDGIVKEWENIKWVFIVSPNYPEYKDLITVMENHNDIEGYPQLSY